MSRIEVVARPGWGSFVVRRQLTCGQLEIQIEKEAPTVVSFSPTTSQAAPDSLQDPFFRTRYEMLKSRSLADTVVGQENLETSLRTAGEPPESMKDFFSFFSVSKWLGTDKPASDGIPEPQADITELFGKNLQIQPIDATHLVNIFYEGSRCRRF